MQEWTPSQEHNPTLAPFPHLCLEEGKGLLWLPWGRWWHKTSQGTSGRSSHSSSLSALGFAMCPQPLCYALVVSRASVSAVKGGAQEECLLSDRNPYFALGKTGNIDSSALSAGNHPARSSHTWHHFIPVNPFYRWRKWGWRRLWLAQGHIANTWQDQDLTSLPLGSASLGIWVLVEVMLEGRKWRGQGWRKPLACAWQKLCPWDSHPLQLFQQRGQIHWYPAPK